MIFLWVFIPYFEGKIMKKELLVKIFPFQEHLTTQMIYWINEWLFINHSLKITDELHVSLFQNWKYFHQNIIVMFHNLTEYTNLSSLKSKSAGVLEYTWKKNMEIRMAWMGQKSFPFPFLFNCFYCFHFTLNNTTQNHQKIVKALKNHFIEGIA